MRSDPDFSDTEMMRRPAAFYGAVKDAIMAASNASEFIEKLKR
jgi:hypothetical protein